MKNNTLIFISVILIIIFGGVGFYAGMKYQQSRRGQFARINSNVQGTQNNQARGRAGVRPVTGEIISQDDTNITVSLSDGGSKIVLLSSKTTINKASEGSKEDLKVGERVALFGSENTDGSISAINIQINPQERELFNQSSRETGKQQ